MRLESKIQTILNIFIILAIVWSIIFGSFNRTDKLILVEQNPSKILTPCQQAQQSKIMVLQTCEKNSSGFYILFPNYLHLFQSTSGIIASLFIIALMTMSPLNRIFKPPKSISLV